MDQHPWGDISLEDYEAHMALPGVGQLAALNRMMKAQLAGAQTLVILGVAGGNGLEHVDPRVTRRVYGVDVNPAYLAACRARYPALMEIFVPIAMDLTREAALLPRAELLVANLVVEYIGCPALAAAVKAVTPQRVSCVIQADSGADFVSPSPWAACFGGLAGIHRALGPAELTAALPDYLLTDTVEEPLPSGKRLLRMDFLRKAPGEPLCGG